MDEDGEEQMMGWDGEEGMEEEEEEEEEEYEADGDVMHDV